MDILSRFAAVPERDCFEPQLQQPNHRMCGAAALVMAYRRCGLNVDQQSIWKSIALEHRGQFRGHTYRMAGDAISRGLSASIIQTHQPWKMLKTCWRNNIHAVVNYRTSPDSAEGHYSLLAGIGNDTIRLLDPLAGPSVEIEKNEFLKLWLPISPHGEIAGNVLLAIALPNGQPDIWCHCNRPMEDSIECRHCGNAISLCPAMALGCWNQLCRDRLWYRIFCPNCDGSLHRIVND